MPYIKPSQRNELEDKITSLVDNICLASLENRSGIVNYVITTIVSRSLKPKDGWRYKWLNVAYGTFHSAASEFYRRLVAPYEDKAIDKNGDILEYISK